MFASISRTFSLVPPLNYARKTSCKKRRLSSPPCAFLKNYKKKEEPLSNEVDENGKPKGMTGKGLSQLVKMGLGAISGDITEINFDDPGRAVVMELEANNFADEKGKPLSTKFMNNEGYTEDRGKTPLLNIFLPVLLGGVTIAVVVATLKALA